MISFFILPLQKKIYLDPVVRGSVVRRYGNPLGSNRMPTGIITP